ncbi:CBS domain-containing protein [Aliiglaciecola sp. LCG003]|uniref:CBS domain-containing protein n=1 Tax=Aliiglaciecola sp. LCG003 TaxID=3053655 RepID=UPI002572F326|nr:CBS domain-containing protein [Aliiglaciecola sp. LCG003]WJG07679.1 CBS domain-containing protein [Aliiglaciecola sp. LCG003]
MNVGEICTKGVPSVTALTSVFDVARIMRQQQVSRVIVMDFRNKDLVPEGVLTERDLVLEVLACKISPQTVTAGDILTSELVCVSENLSVIQALKKMRYFAVSHAVVVDIHGRLVGLLNRENILPFLTYTINQAVNLKSTDNLDETLDFFANK